MQARACPLLIRHASYALGTPPVQRGGASFHEQVWDTALFPRWQSLTSLVLSGCGLAALPVTVGRLTGLHELHVAHNRIAALPRELGALRRLRVLKADDNLLTALPGEQHTAAEGL